MNTTRRLARSLQFDTLESRDNPASSFAAVGAAAGGSPLAQLVRADGTVLTQGQVFETGFTGGVRAAVGELDGDPNTVELVAAAGPGGGPRVKVYSVDIATGRATQIADFFAFEPSFSGGVRVAVGSVGVSDGRQDIIVGADAGGGPRVRTFSLDDGGNASIIAGPLGDFFAYEPTFRGGVRVAAGELDGSTADGDEVLVAAGPTGGPRVRVYRGDGAVLADYFAFRPDFLGGVNVGVESSGGTVDAVRADALADDFSQRSATLDAAAGVAQTTTGTTATTTTGTTLGTTTTGTTLGGTTTTGTTLGGTTTVNASSTPAVQVAGGGTTLGVTGGVDTAGLGTGGIGSASTGYGTGVGLGTSSTGFGTGLGLGSATTGAGGGGLASAGASAGGFTTGGFGTSAFGSTALNGTSVGTTTVPTGQTSVGTTVNNTPFGIPGSGVGGFGTGFGTTGTVVGANGLAVGTNGLPVAFAGTGGSMVYADNPGTLTAFPTLLNPPLATTFGPAQIV